MIGQNPRVTGMTSSHPPNPLPIASPGDRLAPLRALVNDLAVSSRAPATRRAYATAWRRFERWANDHGVLSVPTSPEIVALYLASLVAEGRAAGTIAHALVAIGQVHRDRGDIPPGNDPHVRRVLRGIRRRLGIAPASKAPIAPADLRKMLVYQRRRSAWSA
jgi:hypothetical protein